MTIQSYPLISKGMKTVPNRGRRARHRAPLIAVQEVFGLRSLFLTLLWPPTQPVNGIA